MNGAVPSSARQQPQQSLYEVHEVASRVQLWRHSRIQPTTARPEADEAGQWEQLDNNVSSLAEKGRNAAAVLPVSQTSSSKCTRICQGMHAWHWWVREYVQFVEPPLHASLRLCFRNGGLLRGRRVVEPMPILCRGDQKKMCSR